MKAKIEELEKKLEELINNNGNSKKYSNVKIVTSHEDILTYTKLGYECQPIGNDTWLMRKSNV